MRSFLSICVLLFWATTLFGEIDPRRWSPDQATGEPDTEAPGDFETAWASREPDAGREWLRLKFEKEVAIAAIRIHQSHNPGAIIRVTAYTDPKSGKILWEGQSPVVPAIHVFEVKPKEKVVADNVTILLDTKRVAGWNEIDAVELIGVDGSRQWASEATASTTYASRFPVQVISYETLPPVVVSTIPAAGTLDVDSHETKEILVKFSKDMSTDMKIKLSSFAKNFHPKIDGVIKFRDDQRTCVIPVDLKPGKTYVLSLNDGSSTIFQDAAKNVAMPYQLVFKTKE